MILIKRRNTPLEGSTAGKALEGSTEGRGMCQVAPTAGKRGCVVRHDERGLSVPECGNTCQDG